MTTQSEWIKGIAWPAVPWQDAYAFIERKAKEFLDTHEGTLSTQQLVECLWPENDVRGVEAIDSRQRLYRGLSKTAAHGLALYCHFGPEKILYGRSISPLRWHKADPDRAKEKKPLKRVLPAQWQALLDAIDARKMDIPNEIVELAIQIKGE